MSNKGNDISNYFAIVPGGRIGIISHVGSRQIEVQFGADGPYEFFKRKDLTLATEEEVKAAGWQGVGGKTVNLDKPRKKKIAVSGAIDPVATPGRLRSSD